MSEAQLLLAHRWLLGDQPQRCLDALQAAGDDALSSAGLTLRARALLALDRPAEAREAARRGLQDDVDDVELWSALADAAHAQHDLPAAESAVLSGLRLAPDSVVLLTDYARVLADAGQADKARRVLARAAAVEPESGLVHQTRGYLALTEGDDRAAAAAARRALQLDPGRVSAHALLGAASLARGDARTGLRHSRTAAVERIGDRDLAALAREARLQAHWTMRPLAVITRYGAVPVWAVGVSLMFLAVAVAPDPVAAGVVATYVAYAVYSWVAPPLLRAYARRAW